MATRMLQRRGTAAEWAAENPILSDGEIGFEKDTKVIKLGDGVTPWNDLTVPYVHKSGGVMTGALSLIDPTQPEHAAHKSYVDGEVAAGIATRLPLAGGTLTGKLTGVWAELPGPTPTTSSNPVLDFLSGYGILRDAVGTGLANTRLWVEGPDDGEMVFGPRSGTVLLDTFRVRSQDLRFDGRTITVNAHPYPSAFAVGIHSITFDNSINSGVETVNFPVGRFSAVPNVVTQIASGAGVAARVTVRISSVSATSFSFIADAPAAITASINMQWQAIEML